MSSKRDYYEVLGVGRTASPEELKRAFRGKAREFHPDVSDAHNAAERFKEVNEAYAILSDPDKRAAYDRFGHAAFNGAGGATDPFGGMGFPDLTEIFGDIFGGMRTRPSRRAPRRGQDLQYRLSIEFEEAIFGTEREIEFERTETCHTCRGSGAEPGTTPTRCTTCQGTGSVRNIRQTFLGQIVEFPTCPVCQGRGEVVSSPCQVCTGLGQTRQKRRLTVSIPAGVDHGTQIRISGEGESGLRGGQPGNLYIVVSVRPHKYFRRRGDDLFITLQLNVSQAALGHALMVPTLTKLGEVDTEMEIPPGTQSGEIFVLKGKGVPRLRRDGSHSGYGDLQVMIEVEIPRKLSQEQRFLFEQLAETLGDAVIPPADQRGFFERVLDWLGGE